MMSGLGEGAVRSIAVDPVTQAMDVVALREAMEADVAAGIRPVLVQSAVGTTSTGAIDPTAAIAVVAQEHGAWLHVDAAWAGVAAVCPEHRWIHDGVEQADSYVTNPHKWLLTTFDCSAFWVATAPPCSERCRSFRSTCATRRASPAPSSTTATGTRSWGAGSAR